MNNSRLPQVNGMLDRFISADGGLDRAGYIRTFRALAVSEALPDRERESAITRALASHRSTGPKAFFVLDGYEARADFAVERGKIPSKLFDAVTQRTGEKLYAGVYVVSEAFLCALYDEIELLIERSPDPSGDND